MVDGLIIPRTYNDYFSRSDPAAIRQLVAQFTDAALSATSENPVQNKVVKAALDVINAVIPAGASASDKLALESSVDAIDAKIPTQASAQNQLADKDFVNSSVSTNTANYISNNGQPFTSVAALEAYSGTVTNNDYAFVTGTDADGNVYYDRYKATVSGSSVSWAKEYRLNNSSFTAAQWAAISSGITAAKVAQYDAGVTPTNVVNNGNMSAVTSNAVYNNFLNKYKQVKQLIPSSSSAIIQSSTNNSIFCCYLITISRDSADDTAIGVIYWVYGRGFDIKWIIPPTTSRYTVTITQDSLSKATINVTANYERCLTILDLNGSGILTLS